MFYFRCANCGQIEIAHRAEFRKSKDGKLESLLTDHFMEEPDRPYHSLNPKHVRKGYRLSLANCREFKYRLRDRSGIIRRICESKPSMVEENLPAKWQKAAKRLLDIWYPEEKEGFWPPPVTVYIPYLGGPALILD